MEVTVDYQKVLGAGATATVYQGKNVETGESVAVKVFNGSNNEEEFRVMEAEVILMKKLRHDNIVKFFGSQRQTDTLYVYMELITGGSLQDFYERRHAAVPEALIRAQPKA